VAERYFWAMKPKVWIPVLLLGGLLVWAVFRAHRGAEAGKADPGASSGTADALPLVTVVEPLRKPAVLSLTLPVSVEALNEATLYSKVAGYLQWIKVDKGDRVEKGQILALVEVPEIEKEYQSAQAAVEEAQAVERRAQADESLKEVTYKRLADVRQSQPDVISQQEVDVARAAYAVAQSDAGVAKAKVGLARAELGKLEAQREFAKIRAPYDGVVTARFVDPGALIQQGTNSKSNPIVTVVSIDTVRVYLSVPETSVSYVKQGRPVQVMLDAFPGREFRGSITRFADALDTQTRTMKTEIDLPNPGRHILSGMYGTAKLELSAESGALFVPDQAVHRDAEGHPFVYTVAQNRVQKVAVETGLDDGKLVQVRGLQGDESIVLATTANLQEGLSVKAVKSGP